ncbi:MAG TPA: hypothetical protein DCL60_03385 [Armatimonadetes bacterium]|nr:hypothetical protein [Armatimonadota bacterium]
MFSFKIKSAGIILALTVVAASCTAASLKDSMLLYLDGESLTSTYPGVAIQPSIRVVEDGKYGKALLMERRTTNLVPNGDFKTEDMDGWILSDADRVPSGGIKNTPCLSAKDGAVVALPLTELGVDSAYAFSFYAKSVKAGKIVVELSMGGKVKALGRFDAPAGDFGRIVVSFCPDQDSGTLRLKLSGDVLIDNVQLEKGTTFANTFSEPLKIRGCDWITVPANGGYFNQKQGSISCWVKAPWLENKEFTDVGGSIFSAVCTKPEYTGWGANTAMNIIAWPKSKKGKVTQGNIYHVMIDRTKGMCSGSFGLDQVKPSATGWHHMVFNWKYENGQMTSEIFVDGNSIHTSKTGSFGAPKPVDQIYIGYSRGSYLDGKLDDFAIWSRPLTKEEVLSIYSSDKPLSALGTK